MLSMARPLRIQYPGAVYHVMARGSCGQAIFGDHTDRKVFLETLGESCEKTGWRIHAYVLMDNHYHLLAETPEANLKMGSVITIDTTCHFSQFLKNKIGNGSFFTC
jgi:putative transposase